MVDEAVRKTSRTVTAAGRRAAAAIERRPVLTRWLLAGPGALAAALAIMSAMPIWLPAGAAGVDNIVYPLVLAPLIWAVAFHYTILEERLVRGVAVAVGVILSQGALVMLAVAGLIAGGAA